MGTLGVEVRTVAARDLAMRVGRGREAATESLVREQERVDGRVEGWGREAGMVAAGRVEKMVEKVKEVVTAVTPREGKGREAAVSGMSGVDVVEALRGELARVGAEQEMARVVDEREGGVMGRVAMGEVHSGVAVAAREVVRAVAAMAEGVMAVAMAVGGREEKMVREAPVVVR